MVSSISYYVNPNTKGLTSNLKNAAIKDRAAYDEVMAKQLLNQDAIEDYMAQVRMTPIKFAEKSSLNRQSNSVNIAEGQRIRVEGHVLTVGKGGVSVSGGDHRNPYDTRSCDKAQRLAGVLGSLLQNACGITKNVAYSEEGNTNFTERITELMPYLGIDPSRDFTVNGMKYSKNVKGWFQSQASSDARKAYEQLKLNNRTYRLADEKTKKQNDYISNYYLETVPESVRTAWQEAMEEANVIPFQNDMGSTLTQLSVEQDFATGGDDNILGNTEESCLNAIHRVLGRVEKHLGTVTEDLEAAETAKDKEAIKKAEKEAAYLQQEKEFYTALASKIEGQRAEA